MRSISWRLWLLAALSAVLQLVPFPLAGPVPPWRRLFCWVCLVPLLIALNGKDTEGRPLSAPASALLGYLCGVLWFGGNCYWIFQTMAHYGGLPPLASAGILLLFALYLGLYFALFGYVFALLRRLFGSQAALCLSPVLWVAVELARGRITGFPWDLLGYTQVDNALLTPLAPVTGVMGLSFLVALGNALWVWRLRRGPRWLGPVCAAMLMVLGAVGMGVHQTPAPAGKRAVLLQEDLGVGTEAGRETQAELMESFAAFSRRPQLSGGVRAGRPDVVVWPESPTSFADADPELRQALGAVARAEQAPLIVDAVGTGPELNAEGRPEEFVSASFYLPDGSYAGRYDKMHLVPFGEYTPYKSLFFFAGHLLDGLNFVPGRHRRLFSAAGHRYGVFLCYESIFGDEVRQFALDGAEVLVNLTDDGWYGDTSAPWEHLDMARMRAIENRRWLLRDTNTGVTASIDPEGRMVATLPRHERAALLVPFAYLGGTTFYTRHGDWLGWMCAVLVAGLLGGGWLQRRMDGAKRQTGAVD